MRGKRSALVLMVASGFAALGYQIVWTQQSALWLGHESAAALAVIAAFFGGLGLGALVLGGRIDRSTRPARWYAACELTIAVWSCVLSLLSQPAAGALSHLIGVQPAPLWHWLVVFGGTFLLLSPATIAMGATLPAMERVLASLRREGMSIAALYASNTFGAVLGVLAAAFALVPNVGLTRTALICAALNLACAVAAMKILPARSEPVVAESQATSNSVLGTLAITGLLGIGYEVLVVRALSQVAENTVYTFAILLAVYLIGSAVGAAFYSHRSEPSPAQTRDLSRTGRGDLLLAMLAGACLLGMASLAYAAPIKSWLQYILGAGMTQALMAEAALATAAFLLPSLAMGALFSHLSTSARVSGISFGQALGVNTLGAAIAPVIFGVVLVPEAGVKVALLILVTGYLALVSRNAWRNPIQWIAAGAALAFAIWLPRLVIVDIPPGGHLVNYQEGAMSAVSIVEDANGVATLHIDNRQQEGSSATLFADARQALLPMLLHPAPHRALFLGLGTGVTASAAAMDTKLEVDAVELLPEVILASSYFTRPLDDGAPSSRLHFMAADARRFVRASGQRYDLIVADNFHPARSGSGSLYTVEHFEAVRARLADGGLFCQWLPLHQLDLDTLRSIVRSFLSAYPHGVALLATNSLETPVVGLIGDASDEQRFDVDRLRSRLASIAMKHAPPEFGVVDDFALLGNFIAGPQALARFAGTAPLNTDDRPIVAYRAPRITYAPDSAPHDRLIALLREVDASPSELLSASRSPDFDARLAAYWNARNRFIEVGRDVRPTSDAEQMLAQVRAPLLGVLRISPDFRPAYDPLLRMALALDDTVAARTLLTNLAQVQPARPEAAEALRALSGK